MGNALSDVLLFGKATETDGSDLHLCIFRKRELFFGRTMKNGKVVVKGVSPLVLPGAVADSLEYVKAYGKTEQRNVPVEYVENQFIYMLDGSYLLTDIVPSSDMRIEMDFQTTSILNCRYLGARNFAVAGNGLQLGVESSKFVVDGFQERYQTGQTPTANTRYKFVYNDGAFSMYQGGTLISSHTFTPDQTTTAKMVINAINTAGTISGNTAGIYLYSFKVWDGNGDLIADYVPATLLHPLTVGLYDRVSGTHLLPSAGTWSAGPAVQGTTPSHPIDIVCNNGVLKVNGQGNIYADGDTETITDSSSNTVTAQMLLSVGDYADVQEILTGDITRKVGVAVLDGTESWQQHQSGAFYVGISHLRSFFTVPVLCTHFKAGSGAASDMNAGEVIAAQTTNNVYFKTDYTSLSDWETWLAEQYQNGTPVILVYPLAQDATQSTTAQTLEVKTGSNTLTITDASISDLILEAKYTKGS